MGSLRSMKQRRSEFEYTLDDGEFLVGLILTPHEFAYEREDPDAYRGISDNYAKAIPLLNALSTPFYRKYERRVRRILEGVGEPFFRDFFLGIMSISVYHLLISDDLMSRQENLFETCLTELEYGKKTEIEHWEKNYHRPEDLLAGFTLEYEWEMTLWESRGCIDGTFGFVRNLLLDKIGRESGYTPTYKQLEEILDKGINPNEQR